MYAQVKIQNICRTQDTGKNGYKYSAYIEMLFKLAWSNRLNPGYADKLILSIALSDMGNPIEKMRIAHKIPSLMIADWGASYDGWRANGFEIEADTMWKLVEDIEEIQNTIKEIDTKAMTPRFIKARWPKEYPVLDVSVCPDNGKYQVTALLREDMIMSPPYALLSNGIGYMAIGARIDAQWGQQTQRIEKQTWVTRWITELKNFFDAIAIADETIAGIISLASDREALEPISELLD